MADYVFHVGTVKQASDHICIANYMINHIKMTFEEDKDIAQVLEELQEVNDILLQTIMSCSTETDQTQRDQQNEAYKVIFKIPYKQWELHMRMHQNNKMKAYALLWKHSSKAMQRKIQAKTTNESTIKDNPTEMLKVTKEHAICYKETWYEPATINDVLSSFINLKQRDNKALIDYFKKLMAARDMSKEHVGEMVMFHKMNKQDLVYLVKANLISGDQATRTVAEMVKEKVEKEGKLVHG